MFIYNVYLFSGRGGTRTPTGLLPAHFKCDSATDYDTRPGDETIIADTAWIVKWEILDSNQAPHDYQSCALTE